MSDTMEISRRWSGYVCPDCRFVFRVPRDHDGKGIVCPSCRRMLRIPAATDEPPPLMAPLRQAVAGAALAGPEPERVKKRRKGKKSNKGEDHSWEASPKKTGSKRLENKQMRWMLIGGGILFLMSLGGVIVSLNTDPPVPPPPVAVSNPVIEPKELKASERSDVSILSEMEPLAKTFLEAKTPEELLPTVRNPELVEARIRSYDPQGKISSPGMAKFNTSGTIARKDSFVAVSLRTRDQEERQLAFVETPQGLRIDWEAWVGWSEVSWADFISTKPSDPKTFRLTLAKVDYYNFNYVDDVKWRSYRIESPDGAHSLYGYVERGSEVDRQINIDADTKNLSLMLSLKFPPDSNGKDQVEIVSLIAEGWVQ